MVEAMRRHVGLGLVAMLASCAAFGTSGPFAKSPDDRWLEPRRGGAHPHRRRGSRPGALRAVGMRGRWGTLRSELPRRQRRRGCRRTPRAAARCAGSPAHTPQPEGRRVGTAGLQPAVIGNLAKGPDVRSPRRVQHHDRPRFAMLPHRLDHDIPRFLNDQHPTSMGSWQCVRNKVNCCH